MLAFTNLRRGLERRKVSQTACTMWTADPRGRRRAGATENESEDARKLKRENERRRLESSNDALHNEQEGRVYIHALYLLSKSEIIRNENGDVTVKSEGRNLARVVLHRAQRGSE
jgi:hypothetical protein